MILAPSKELCSQIGKVLESLTIKCSKIIKWINLSSKSEAATQKFIISQKPDIIISTPTRILNHMKQKTIDLKESLEILVMDEADLLFSFGFEEDIKNILTNYMPSTYQVFFLLISLVHLVTFLFIFLVNPSFSNIKF